MNWYAVYYSADNELAKLVIDIDPRDFVKSLLNNMDIATAIENLVCIEVVDENGKVWYTIRVR
jgi:hypothetical protein